MSITLTPPAEESIAIAQKSERVGEERFPRVIGRIEGELSGDSPTLICVGGLHGNEPAGVLGLRRVLGTLAADEVKLHGTVVGFSGNRQALVKRRRFLNNDLNRYWSRDRVERLRRSQGPLTAEDEELVALDRELQRVLAHAAGKVFFLDLHTTSGPGPAFVNLDDTLVNRRFALAFPVPLVVGLEEELEGTLASFLIRQGAITVGFESGQHDEPAAVDRAADAAWIALELSGVLPRGARPEVEAARHRLAAASKGLPHVVEVRYRHPVVPGADFKMKPGFKSFVAIKAGQILATDREGLILAQETGRLLMPLYQELGNDGFFVIRPVHPIWLKVSALFRHWHVERFVHLLPGVKRHPEESGSFIVDRRLARWWALEVFHLLGFQRRGARYDRFLIMNRRRQAWE